MGTSADYSTEALLTDTAPEGERDLVGLLGALLFAAPGPVSPARLAEAAGVTPRQVEAALPDLQARLAPVGLVVQRHRSGWQVVTVPEAAGAVERLLEMENVVRLSPAALEVLAIVAYREPVTRPQIDAIRGVNSESALRTLVRYGLVEEAGRSEAPGRPILYQTTPLFLEQFGLKSIEDLPPLEDGAEAEEEAPAEALP